MIPERARRYLLNLDGSVIRYRYEFLVYRHLRDRLEAGDLFCPDSIRYRSFEDDLVGDATLEKKATLLPQLGLVVAASSMKEPLAVLQDTLAAPARTALSCFGAASLSGHADTILGSHFATSRFSMPSNASISIRFCCSWIGVPTSCQPSNTSWAGMSARRPTSQ